MQDKKRAPATGMRFFRKLLILILCISLLSVNTLNTLSVNAAADNTEEEEEFVEDASEATGAKKTEAQTSGAQETEAVTETIGVIETEDTSVNETEKVTADESEEETVPESETTSNTEVPKILGSIRAGQTEVGTWEQFVAALQTDDVSHIVLTANITRVGTAVATQPGSISRNLIIDGGTAGYSINFGTVATVAAPIILDNIGEAKTLTLNNVTLIKGAGPAFAMIYSSTGGVNWNIILNNVKTNTSITGTANAAGLVNAASASVTVYGTDNNLSFFNTGGSLFNVGSFNMAEGSAMTATARSTGNLFKVNSGDFTIASGANLNTISTIGTTSNSLYSFDISGSITMGANSQLSATSLVSSLFKVGGSFTMADGTTSLSAITTGTGNSFNQFNVTGDFTVGIGNTFTTSTATTNMSTAYYQVGVGGNFTIKSDSQVTATSAGASIFNVGGNFVIEEGAKPLSATTTGTGQTNYQFNVGGNFEMGRGTNITTSTASTSESATLYQVNVVGDFVMGADTELTAISVRKSLMNVGKNFIVGENASLSVESTSTAQSDYQINVGIDFLMKEGSEFSTKTATTANNDTYYQVAVSGNFTMENDTTLIADSAGKSLFRVNGDFTVGEDAEVTANSTSAANRMFFVKNFIANANSTITTTSVGATYQFYITGNLMMESDGTEGTGSTLSASASGAANSIIFMQGGEVNLRKYSTVTIRNNGTTSDATGATGSNGIYGAVTHMNLEGGSVLDIYAHSVGYRSNTTNYLTMVDGAVFKVETSVQAAIMLQNSTAESTSNPAFITLSGKGTQLLISTNSVSTGNIGAAMIVSGDNTTEGSSRFTVTDGAEIIGYSESNSVIQVRASGSIFTIKDGGRIELTQDRNSNDIVAALRFRVVGNQTFIIDGGEVYIHKTGGDCPAVRLYGGGNSITVKNGGVFKVYNEGNGSPNNGSGNAGNQGIYYTNGAVNNPDSFSLSGYGSKVEIVADYGPAIFNSGGASSITVDYQSIFIAHGRTAGVAFGVINASGPSTIVLDHPLYFDIRNNHPSGGNAIDAGNANSTFTTVQSDLSVWKKGSDMDGNPSATWSLFDYSLRGADFRTIVSTSVPDEFNTSTYGMASDYSRISANNATAVVDEIRVSTNADKYIFGHAYVPEGLEQQRDAWTDEVYVTVQVKDTNGNIVFTDKGATVGAANDNSNDGLSVYGEPDRAGIFKIMYDPDGDGTGDYLPTDYTIEVVAAWRGAADPTSNRVHTSTPDDLKATEVTTVDVTPPAAITVDDLDQSVRMYEGELTTRVTQISGTSEEVGEKIYLYHKRDSGWTVWATGVVGADQKWSFTLPYALEDGDMIAVALNDDVPNADNLTSYDIDKLTNSGVFANNGNENPSGDFTFHDATFSTRLELGVVYYGVLELTVSPEIEYGTHGISPGRTSYPAGAMELKIEDSRVFKVQWELMAELERPFTLDGGSAVLDIDLVYAYNGAETIIGDTAVSIWRGTNTDDVFDLYDQWDISQSANGLFIKASAGNVRTGSYTATVNWVLADVP